jgi:hypothetical protein
MQIAKAAPAPSRLTLGGRYAYLIVAWLFVAAVVVQVSLIGLTFFPTNGHVIDYSLHITFGHMLGPFLLVLFLCSLLARLPRGMIGFTALLLLLFGLQYFFANTALAGAGWVFACWRSSWPGAPGASCRPRWAR